jgi:hypothetical protein
MFSCIFNIVILCECNSYEVVGPIVNIYQYDMMIGPIANIYQYDMMIGPIANIYQYDMMIGHHM